MLTSRYTPFHRPGIKLYGAAGEITKADETRISQADVTLPGTIEAEPLTAINLQARQTYIERYTRFFPARCLAGMKLGFYQHSSVARDLLVELLQDLGAEVIPLGRTDEFVPIDTEAVSAADLEQARQWAAQYGFDAILSTDGDADRPLLGDENGEWLRGDIAGILCAHYLGAQAVATTVSSNTALEACGFFPRIIRTRIGSPYVIEGIEELIRHGARNVVGFEPNGGFLVGTGISKNGRFLAPLMTRDAVLPILCLLALAREKGDKVSALAQGLPPRFTASDRLQDFPTETSLAMLLEFSTYPKALLSLLDGLCGKPVGLDQTDGLRITLEGNEIVHLRPSGNAPELRCYAEAATQKRAGELVQACLQRLLARLELQTFIKNQD